MKIMKKFFLFTKRGMTDRFFCGNIYEAFSSDEIRYHGEMMDFAFCVQIGACKEFSTRKDANEYSRSEEEAMEDSNNYAQKAMDAEEFGYSDY